jgi:hypothetical protein
MSASERQTYCRSLSPRGTFQRQSHKVDALVARAHVRRLKLYHDPISDESEMTRTSVSFTTTWRLSRVALPCQADGQTISSGLHYPDWCVSHGRVAFAAICC